MNCTLRLARPDDVPKLEELIPLSVRALQAPYYSWVQMEAALGPVFGVDRQLIEDGSYFVAEYQGQLVGCGGWSKRRSHFGSDREQAEEDRALLDPKYDAARIRAFFVHPAWARRGIGRCLLLACEKAIIEAGFPAIELVATLAGEPLYAAFSYGVVQRYDISLPNGLGLPVVRMRKRLLPAQR